MTRFILVCVTSASVACALAAQPLTNGVALAYFAPANQLFYRMRYPDGGYREFERDLNDLSRMHGAQGWQLRLGKGDRATVTGKGDAGRETYVFEKGRLISCALPGETNTFDYATPRLVGEDELQPYHYGSKIERAITPKANARRPVTVKQLLAGKWKKSGRLCWPFQNPNESGFLYASFALLALYLTTLKRRGWVIAGWVLCAAFMVPLVMTASRGSFLAFAVGALPVMAVRFRALVRSKAAWLTLAAVLVFGGVWFGTHSSRLLTRGFRGKSKWSNNTRFEMWSMAPRMMADAPGGWVANPGKAYLDWYECPSEFSAAGSLINDHLSSLVCQSWTKRWLYAFGWGALLAWLLLWGARTKNMVPAGIFAAYAVGCWFNTLMINKWLWSAPLISLVPVLTSRPWRFWRRGCVALGVGVMFATVALGVLMRMGRATPHPYGVFVGADGLRVAVGGPNPDVWIVDDGLSLGGAFAAKEIRSWFVQNPESKPVGYVRHCTELPKHGVRRLVLGGEAGDAWLTLLSKNEAAQKRLPQEVVFVSPPFPPSALPPALMANARVKYVTGEFNARYSRDFDNPPPFVEVVPAMELYLPRWMRFTQ